MTDYVIVPTVAKKHTSKLIVQYAHANAILNEPCFMAPDMKPTTVPNMLPTRIGVIPAPTSSPNKLAVSIRADGESRIDPRRAAQINEITVTAKIADSDRDNAQSPLLFA